MPPSVARRTLERAKFFNQQAELAASDDREKFRHFIEASIVFGRSVTFHLQKEYSHVDGFETWYAEKREEMSDDPICQFFLRKRNYILKEGPIGIARTVSVVFADTIAMSEHLEIKVIRGKPWYRRSMRTLWRDSRRRVLRLLRKLTKGIRALRKAGSKRPLSSTASVSDRIHFEDPDFRNRPATEVISDYIGYLEEIVEEAEHRFHSS